MVVALCLRKDVRQRISDIRDVRLALEGAFHTASGLSPATTAPRSARTRAKCMAIVAVIALVAAAGTGVRSLWRSAGRTTERQFPVPGAGEGRDRQLRPISRLAVRCLCDKGERRSYGSAPSNRSTRKNCPAQTERGLLRVRCSGHPIAAPSGSWQTENSRRRSISGGPPQTLTDVLDSARGRGVNRASS